MTAMREQRKDEETLSAERFEDPYDSMTDEEFDAYVSRLFEEPQGPTRSITLRMPETLLVRIQKIASQRHVPYQKLMKRMLEESVNTLERRLPTRPADQRTRASRR